MPQQLLITLNDDMSVNVQGPLGNKILCYGMLEGPRDAIAAFKPDANGIVPVRPTLIVPKS